MKQKILKTLLLIIVAFTSYSAKAQAQTVNISNNSTWAACCVVIRVYDNLGTLLFTSSSICAQGSGGALCISGLAAYITVDDGSCAPWRVNINAGGGTCGLCIGCNTQCSGALTATASNSGIPGAPTCSTPQTLNITLN